MKGLAKLRTSLATAILAILTAAPPAAAEVIYVSCHVSYQNGAVSDYAIVLDTAAQSVRVDGDTLTAAGTPRRVRQDDGTIDTVIDQVFKFDADVIEWGVIFKGNRIDITSINRITGQYWNQYGSGPCTKVPGPKF